MVLEHFAAILIFSGPVLYIGLWMVIDPAGMVMIPSWVVRVSQSAVQKISGLQSGEIVEPDHVTISRRTRKALRLAGLALVLFAIAA